MLKYYEEKNVRVTPVLVSGLQYLEQIHEAQMSGEGAPDLYIISNDTLEKAYLSGLAAQITDPLSYLTLKSKLKAFLPTLILSLHCVALLFYRHFFKMAIISSTSCFPITRGGTYIKL